MQNGKTLPAAFPLLSRALRVIRSEGLPGLTLRVTDRINSNFTWTPAYLLLYSVNPNDPLPQAKADLQVEQVTANDREAIRELVDMYQFPTREEDILDRLSLPKYCYVGRVDGKIVAYVWIQHSGAIHDFGGSVLQLQPDETYDHDVYTVPAQRGKNLFPVMKALIARALLRDYGKQKMLSFVFTNNKPSLNASRKLGEERIAFLLYLKLFGRRSHYLFRHKPLRL